MEAKVETAIYLEIVQGLASDDFAHEGFARGASRDECSIRAGHPLPDYVTTLDVSLTSLNAALYVA